MRIALIVGNPIRDLAGMVLLAQQLCREGATCYLVPGELRQYELAALAPDFVLLDNLRRARSEIAAQLMEAGVKVGVLDNEGGVFSSFAWYGDALNPDKDFRHGISCFCSWGTRLAEHAVEQDWYRSEQVHVTGHPRFDFYAPQWRDISLPDAPHAKDWKRPLVLISGRYALANPSSGKPKEKSELVVRLRNYDAERAQKLLEAQRTGMAEMVKLTNNLASRFPSTTFVYRPHPFERPETYHELLNLKDNPNLHIVKQGSIHGWLSIADALIHRGCTTAIEAGMLDVPALSPRWVATLEEIESSESVSIPCSTQEELENKIAQLEEGLLSRSDEIKQRHQQVIHDWFYKIDGQAHQRVANAILQNIPNTPVNLNKCKELLDEQSKGSSSLTSRLKSTLRGGGKAQTRRWLESDKAFDVLQVQEILSSIKSGNTSTLADTRQVVATEAHKENGYHVKIAGGYSVMLRPVQTDKI